MVEASRNPGVFSSEPTANSLDDPPPAVQALLGSMLSLDDPRHARLRRIVARGFTPRMIQKAELDMAALARGIVDAFIDHGPGDFVTELAMPLPLEIICSMMGVPHEARSDVVAATDVLMQSLGDPEYRSPDGRNRATVLAEQLTTLQGLAAELARERRVRPVDDMVTALVTADAAGEALSDADVGKFFVLLVSAGNETTRNALSHALTLFTEHQDQHDLLVADLDERLPGAVEEVLRYATPVNWMRRTVKTDVDLLGQTYHAGDRVIMYYISANRDESVFTEPYRFDITRSPNPHVTFGDPARTSASARTSPAARSQSCCGSCLPGCPGIHATAPPVRQRASSINAIASLPCAF